MEIVPVRYHSMLMDSLRWEGFPFRKGDIVICTPPKCGTTWTQMICALLIFQTPQLEKPLSDYSPWLDMKIRSKEEAWEMLEQQDNRRFIKTHTPLDGLPQDEKVFYLCVGRDPRDAFFSLQNHGANLNEEVFKQILQDQAVDQQNDPYAVEDLSLLSAEERFWRWVDGDWPLGRGPFSLKKVLHHYQLAWNRRDSQNVISMHYAAMKADLEGQMRQLASRLGIEVPESVWPQLVEAARFESMKERASQLAPDAKKGAWKEVDNFFHRGGGGYWRDLFSESDMERYMQRASVLASPEVLKWAHQSAASL